MCHPLDLNLILSGIVGYYCQCGELLEYEDEINNDLCFNCQAYEADMRLDYRTKPATRILSAAEIDEVCGVSHRRKP